MTIVDKLKLEMEKGMTVDVAIEWLHSNGASKSLSIAQLVEVYSIPMADAKTLVHRHRIWSGVKARDEDFHEELMDVLENKEKKL